MPSGKPGEQALVVAPDQRDWVAIRAAYEENVLSLPALYAQYGVMRTEVDTHRRNEEWTPRNRTAAARGTIVGRLYRILDRMTGLMEKDLTQVDETKIAMLNNVTRTLEKLIELSRTEDRRHGHHPGETVAMKHLKEKLAARIEQINRG